MDDDMMSDLRRTYEGTRVLLTGHTGFKGGWLSLWLHQLGAQVTGLSLPPEDAQSLFESARIGDIVDSIEGDIRDADTVVEVMERAEPEIVFHLAAQALVRSSYEQPVETYATNVMGTVHVLEAARSVSSVKAVVIVTSDKCYENADQLWPCREIDSLGGADPYSSSKGCAELVTSAYRRSFFSKSDSCAVASARAGNVIGGGDWAIDRLIPDVVRSVASDVPVAIRNPHAIRPWQHVLEPLAGYLMLGARLLGEGDRWAESWNFGPSADDTIEVMDLAERMIKRWSRGSLEVRTESDPPSEQHQLRLDSSKARAVLGWRPRLTAKQAVDLTVDWYDGYLEDPAAARRLTQGQIHAYMGTSA